MLCGWASIDEHGHTRNGKAGDQTGREVKTGNWYDFGQNVIIRFKNRDKAKKEAKIAKQAKKAAKKEKVAAKKAETQNHIKQATAYYNDNAKPGSLASKANMVKKFDEKNAK